MRAHKLSISIPKELLDFLEEYKTFQQLNNRSEVIQEALKLLRQVQLEQYYAEANQEITDAFEATSNDGLEHEAW